MQEKGQEKRPLTLPSSEFAQSLINQSTLSVTDKYLKDWVRDNS